MRVLMGGQPVLVGRLLAVPEAQEGRFGCVDVVVVVHSRRLRVYRRPVDHPPHITAERAEPRSRLRCRRCVEVLVLVWPRRPSEEW